MKTLTYALIALTVAIPSLASANEEQKVHTDKARAIFEMLADEDRGNG